MVVAPLVESLSGDPKMPTGVRDIVRLLGMTENLSLPGYGPFVIDGHVHTSC